MRRHPAFIGAAMAQSLRCMKEDLAFQKLSGGIQLIAVTCRSCPWLSLTMVYRSSRWGRRCCFPNIQQMENRFSATRRDIVCGRIRALQWCETKRYIERMRAPFLSVSFTTLEHELCAWIALAVCLKFGCILPCSQILNCVPITYGILMSHPWMSEWSCNSDWTHPWKQCTRCLTNSIGLVYFTSIPRKGIRTIRLDRAKMPANRLRILDRLRHDAQRNKTHRRRSSRPWWVAPSYASVDHLNAVMMRITLRDISVRCTANPWKSFNGWARQSADDVNVQRSILARTEMSYLMTKILPHGKRKPRIANEWFYEAGLLVAPWNLSLCWMLVDAPLQSTFVIRRDRCLRSSRDCQYANLFADKTN